MLSTFYKYTDLVFVYVINLYKGIIIKFWYKSDRLYNVIHLYSKHLLI